MQRELEDQARDREQLLVMGEMASSLAHELKNPLAGMMLSAGRLQRALQHDGNLHPIAGSLCASIQALSETVNRITGAVSHPPLGLEPVDLNRVLEEAARTVERQAEGQGIRIVCRLAPNLPTVNGDAALLRCSVRNVLANAIEAMPSGGTLRLESRDGPNGRIEVLVADSGPGLPPQLAESPFKPFRSTKPGRVGLGLSVVRRVLELHGGEAVLRPGGNGGTEVLLEIPAVREGGRQT
jgi:signal transduction histidine kinase